METEIIWKYLHYRLWYLVWRTLKAHLQLFTEPLYPWISDLGLLTCGSIKRRSTILTEVHPFMSIYGGNIKIWNPL